MAGEDTSSALTRRRLLIGAAGVGGVAVLGFGAYQFAPDSVKRRLGDRPDWYIPDAPEGKITLEKIYSEMRGREVELFTAVPAGHGDGAGLPVVVILHGSSATPAGYREFGFGQFLTQAVRDGAPPFVLAGSDALDSSTGWEPNPGGADDPQAMVVEELPTWLADRGFDAANRALWGWSMGGLGVLRLAEAYPDWAVAAAVFSPALSLGGSAVQDADQLADLPLAIWCGTADAFYDADREFVDSLATPPEETAWVDGEAHTRTFWNDHTLDAFAFLADHLST